MTRISTHPSRSRLLERLQVAASDLMRPWQGDVFRFVDPRYSRRGDIFSGQGAMHVSGRWHLVGMGKVAYTAVEPETAMAESFAAALYHGFPVSSATPLVLVSGHADIANMLDLTDGSVRRALRITRRSLLDTDWRADNANGQEAVTQAIGWALKNAGVQAALVPSAAHPGGKNLIVFPDNLAGPSHLRLLRAVVWPR